MFKKAQAACFSFSSLMACSTLSIRLGTSLSARTSEVGTAIMADNTVASSSSRDGNDRKRFDRRHIQDLATHDTDLDIQFIIGFGKFAQDLRRCDRIIVTDGDGAGALKLILDQRDIVSLGSTPQHGIFDHLEFNVRFPQFAAQLSYRTDIHAFVIGKDNHLALAQPFLQLLDKLFFGLDIQS